MWLRRCGATALRHLLCVLLRPGCGVGIALCRHAGFGDSYLLTAKNGGAWLSSAAAWHCRDCHLSGSCSPLVAVAESIALSVMIQLSAANSKRRR